LKARWVDYSEVWPGLSGRGLPLCLLDQAETEEF
jgi:hypothetical protein